MNLMPSFAQLVSAASVVVPLVASKEMQSISQTQFLSDSIISLTNNTWTLQSHDEVFTDLDARVPGDLLSDLMMNGLIDDPYFDRNFLSQDKVWAGDGCDDEQMMDKNCMQRRTWIYSTEFDIPEIDRFQMSWRVVLEGIKMGADILLNGQKIGQVVDQFLRYDFEIGNDALQKGLLYDRSLRRHNLTISFDPSIRVNGRFAACSGGWDWAPYTRTKDAQELRMFTLGIFKPIYIIGIRTERFFISDVVPKVYYLGSYPTKPLQHPEGDFRVDIDVHLGFPKAQTHRSSANSSIIVKTDFADQVKVPVGASVSKPMDTLSTVVTVSLIAPKEVVQLWWPNGMGNQPLYNIYVQTDQSRDKWIQKRIGFRTTSLVTMNENNAFDMMKALHDITEGSGQHGMYFRVNGAIVMARGANFVPMDQMEGRLSSEAHKIAVQSASKANMNMIRIWGGGMVPLDSFYDTCDEEGILIYHDMMFVDEEGHRPLRTDTISKEIRHLVRSLASHPSLLVWNGCNECSVEMGTPSEIYATFVMKTVIEEDDTRPIWPSSPSSHGWKTGVRRLDGRPLARNTSLVTWGQNAFPNALESHGPYMRSFSHSYPGVNGCDVHVPYTNTPPKLKEVNVGYDYRNQFASEFGSTTMSSFESMSGTITLWSLHGGSGPDKCIHDHGNDNKCIGTNVMAERHQLFSRHYVIEMGKNYPCDSHIRAYFGVDEVELSEIGETAFQKQLFMCLMAQTLWMKGEIESRRSKNFFGLLIWQFNEVWPTGGWGLLEYGSKTQDGSQILGGRWKPLMHLLESSLFVDQIAACGVGDLCYVRNDYFDRVDVVVTFEAWTLDSNKPLRIYDHTHKLGPGSIGWFKLPLDFTSNIEVTLIRLQVYHDSFNSNPRVLESVYLKDMPKHIKGLRNDVHVNIIDISAKKNGDAGIVLESDKLALFVVLTTRAEGRFSPNCFTLRPSEKKTISFQPLESGEKVDLETLKATLRIEHLGLYLNSSNSSTVVADS